MGMLESINQPSDLSALDEDQLAALASEIRSFLVDRVSATGGHLGPNLGVVELTLALHRTFDSPRDAILWDTGHQSYVHKIVTGRAGEFETLRQTDGLSGYPSRAESEHDVIENSHASTALAYADGIAKAWSLRDQLATGSEPGRHVVAVVGDGALTGGMSWESLNNIAGSDRQVIIVVNDNERSYAPTIGGLAHHLATLRTTDGYERFLGWGKRVVKRAPMVGGPTYDALHGLKKGVKDMVAPQGMFEDLGLKYIGPVPGHDIEALEFALTRAKSYNGPVIVHAITDKGHGYRPAELDEADRLHGIGVIHPETGKSVAASVPSWTSVFSDEIVKAGATDERIVAITAAMLAPTGLQAFADAYPSRTFDVGIAEQHAVTSASGMAFAGLHPVVAVYASFINRAFDQVLFDAAMHRAPVTFVLDRAGITGPDGASHNGMWDMSLLAIVPDIRIAAPRDGQRLRDLFNEALAINDGPSVVRFPSGAVPADIEAVSARGSVDILRNPEESDALLIVAVGATAGICLAAAELAANSGVVVRVVDPQWVAPIPPELIDLVAESSAVVTVEDNIRTGGVGSQLSQAARDAGIDIPMRDHGLPEAFLAHGKRADVQQAADMVAEAIAARVVELHRTTSTA
ncbi:MAG: 1-deoxy-D-xylulose-5-phosphate synthase [Actinobacteria bacterium]|nr:1-deoxy-D-xylulose-5-phosphate synthase [Actinomycetota bacterium]